MFGKEIDPLTFVSIILKVAMLLFYQLPHYFSNTADTSRCGI